MKRSETLSALACTLSGGLGPLLPNPHLQLTRARNLRLSRSALAAERQPVSQTENMSTQPFQTRQCFFAFLDVLGFKELVGGSAHEKLLKLYGNAFVGNAAMAVSSGKFKVIDQETGQKVAVPDFSEARVSCAVISDSVLLYSADCGMRSFIDICAAVGRLLVSGFSTGLPMRGGIALGDLGVFDGRAMDANFTIHSLVGLALVRAYQEESAHEWAGCTIQDECIEHYSSLVRRFSSAAPDLATLDLMESQGMIAQYKAPRKDGAGSKKWVVDWPRHNRSPVSSEMVEKAFGMHGKSTADVSIRRKVQNTLDYLEFSHDKQGRSA
jgi:hypothetical protein